jgi:hypothetical protein
LVGQQIFAYEDLGVEFLRRLIVEGLFVVAIDDLYEGDSCIGGHKGRKP